MKLIKSDKHSEVYEDGNKIIKKYKPGQERQLKNPKWLIYFDDFNSKYDLFPKIYELTTEEEITTCVMEKLEGKTLQQTVFDAISKSILKEYRIQVMYWMKQTHDLAGCFLEYNIELSKAPGGKIIVHEDLNLNNIIVTPSGKLKLIDLDSLLIFPVKTYTPFTYYARWLSEFHNHTVHLE